MPAIYAVCRIGITLGLLILATPAWAAPDELALAEAERLALDGAPWLKHHRAAAQAASERVVYEGRLPDPQLVLGAINVPTDSWRFDAEDMTMVMLGLRQTFPPGRTLELRERKASEEQVRENARADMETRNLLRQVRLYWLDLYYQEAALRQIAEARRLQQKQLESTEGRFRAAQEPPQAVFKARAALARLNERIPMIEAQRARVRAQLGHWIGDAAFVPLPSTLPSLPAFATFDTEQHPGIQSARAMEAAARTAVDLASQEYKPGWMIDIGYGMRQKTPDGRDRSNMLSATVAVDLPLFRASRQDRRVAEKLAQADGAQHETEDKRRELEMQYRGLRAEYEALSERATVFQNELLPALKRETQVTATGFARDQTDYRDAQLRLLDAELEYTRLRVDIARTHAELLYLAGEQQP
jgi:outer membrane protein TolC